MNLGILNIKTLIELNSRLRGRLGPQGVRRRRVHTKNLDRGALVVNFHNPNMEALCQCLDEFKTRLNTAKTLPVALHAISCFWQDFYLTLKPFSEGNESTARYVVQEVLSQYGYVIPNYYLIHSFQETADRKTNIKILRELFKNSIEPQSSHVS